jgi:hypothetical protein
MLKISGFETRLLVKLLTILFSFLTMNSFLTFLKMTDETKDGGGCCGEGCS